MLPAASHAPVPSSRLCTCLPRSLMTGCGHAALLARRRRLSTPLFALPLGVRRPMGICAMLRCANIFWNFASD